MNKILNILIDNEIYRNAVSRRTREFLVLFATHYFDGFRIFTIFLVLSVVAVRLVIANEFFRDTFSITASAIIQ